MATEPNFLPNSASESEVNQDNSNSKVCIRKEMTELILWHNWRKSLLVFLVLQSLIYDLTYKSAISVVSVSGQIVLWISIGYRVYVRCLQWMNRTQIQGNPFQKYLDMDLSITPQQSQQISCIVLSKIGGFLTKLRSIAFMESPIESVKWMGILGGMSLVGHFFYVSTLIRLGLLLLFTMPKIYKLKQPLIDDRLNTLQQLLNYFCPGKSTEMKTNSKLLGVLDDKTLEQCNKKIGQKIPTNPQNTCLSSDTEIPEELCAGGDDIKTMKMEEEKTCDDFERFDETWKDEDITDFMIRKNL